MKKLLCLLLMLLLCLPLGACAAQNAQTTVVASFYPVYIFAQNLLKDVPDITVSSLTPPTTGCLHDYQLLTSDMRTLDGASMLLINGAGMESFLPDVQKQFPSLPVIDCSTGVELMEDEHGANAHIWLDPKNAAQMVRNMADGLAQQLPTHAEVIEKNAAAYIDRLTALDEEIAQALSTVNNREIVTFHEAFPYFAKAYGLQVIATVTLDPDEAPSPTELAQVVDQVRAANNCPLFAEPNVTSDALKTVAAETGASVYTLDPVTTGDGAPDDYENKMRQNLATLLAALKDE